MSRNTKLVVAFVAFLGVIFVAFKYLSNVNIPVLSPAGPIGEQERNLIVLAVVLSAIVVIPVYFMLVYFAIKYREGNKKARYDPDFDHSRLIESIWWGVPLIIIFILATVTWRASHQLHPFKPLAADKKPLTIQVVALQWKWLFIYPEHDVATVNLVHFPEKTAVKFEVTADAPMNSFWIPKLGGQIYAMSGMSTNLHLMANSTGTYQGQSANISGAGFAKMTFVANSISNADFSQWVHLLKQYRHNLDMNTYKQLAAPSKNNQIDYFSSVEDDLYHKVVNSFLEAS